MAERRMFAKTIIDSDAFLDMPTSSQALYFHLSMRADDEGFVNNPKKIQRMVGSTEDDLKLLIAKNFILTFESGVIVIKHWKIHNYIRADRLAKTKYEEERALITTKENGSYTYLNGNEMEIENTDLRKLAYSKSTLPYSFNYKMKRAFENKTCPICNKTMTSSIKLLTPTIQHNIPISKGGLHELENISIICLSCNTSIQDKTTEKLNQEDVIKTWDRIVELEKNGIEWYWDLTKLDKCQSIDCQMSAQDSIGKVSIDKNNKENNKKKNFIKPTLEQIQSFINEHSLNVDANIFYDYYESNGWMVGKNKMKSYEATLRRWSRTQKAEIKPKWMDEEIKAEKSKVEVTEEDLRYVGIIE